MNKENEVFNKKCAEYLGWEYHSHSALSPPVNVEWWINDKNDYVLNLHFDSDWNWIMLVLLKILEECKEEGDVAPYYDITDNIPFLENIKQAILDYVDNNR